jgi:hypothetical protein
VIRLLAAAALIATLLVPAAATGATNGRVFRLTDPRIVEASSLVDFGARMVTANDSGNPPDLFSVDSRTGRTVGVTHLRVDAVDIEALAPAGNSRVWVGDIGDNTSRRPFVSLYLAPVAARDLEVTPPTYRLVYPDGPQDAESLFTDRAGRVYVVSKALTGGSVYRAGPRLSTSRLNRLVRVANVPEFATDAAMLPDHRHVLIRGYGDAGLYTFPGFRRLGGFALPAQPQGEGISVGRDGRIRLSSEGHDSAVLQVALPASLRAKLTPKAAASPSPSPATSGEPPRDVGGPDTHDFTAWRWALPAVILGGVVALGLTLRRRRR